MSIPTQSTRKFLGNYVISKDEKTLENQCSAVVTVKGADEVVDPIGLPVIWDDTDSFEFYDNSSDISALTTEPDGLGGAVVGIVVGDSRGEGLNEFDVTVPAAGVPMTVLFRDAVVNGDNIDWSVTDVDGAASVTPAAGAVITAFTNQLEKQRVNVKSSATEVDPTYVEA